MAEANGLVVLYQTKYVIRMVSPALHESIAPSTDSTKRHSMARKLNRNQIIIQFGIH